METKVQEEIPVPYNAGDDSKKWPHPVARVPSWAAARTDLKRGETLLSPENVVTYLKDHIAGMDKECFVVLYLDTQNHVLYADAQFGTIDHTAVYPREVLKQALDINAAGLILAHNHPGGSLQPSEGDKELTRRTVTAAKAMGISVHDHLIMTHEGHFAFRQAGLL